MTTLAKITCFFVVAFSVGLGATIGLRMDKDTMSVVFGFILGAAFVVIAFAIPIIIGVRKFMARNNSIVVQSRNNKVYGYLRDGYQ